MNQALYTICKAVHHRKIECGILPGECSVSTQNGSGKRAWPLLDARCGHTKGVLPDRETFQVDHNLMTGGVVRALDRRIPYRNGYGIRLHS